MGLELDTDIMDTMASVRQSPTPLDRLLMDFTVVLEPVSPMDMVLDMEDMDMLVDIMARGRLMLVPTPLYRLLMDFTVVLSPVSLMAMVLDMEDMDTLVDTMARGRLMLVPTPLDKLLLVLPLPMPMLLDTPTMLELLLVYLMDMVLDMDMLATFMDKLKSKAKIGKKDKVHILYFDQQQ